jgi:hypothetical protein
MWAAHLEELAEPFAEGVGVVEFGGGLSREEADEAAREDVERFRHECEVRTVAAWATDAERADFLADVEKKRGKAEAQRLRRDVWNLIRGK